MIIKFSNLGAIKETELDLRPLTVIIGPNNSNKTYIAYSVYGIFDRLFKSSGFVHDRIIVQKDAWNYSVDIQDLISAASRYSKEMVKGFAGRLDNFFQDSNRRLFAKTRFEINIATDELVLNPHWVKQMLKTRLGRNSTVSLENDQLLIQINKSNQDADKSIPFLQDEISDILSLSLKTATFSRPFILPAERNTLVLIFKLLENRRYKLLKQAQRLSFDRSKRTERQLERIREQGDIQYPQPVEDFLDFIADIELQSEKLVNKNQKNDFQRLADSIELQLQSGNKIYLRPNNLGGREIAVQVEEGLEIDLYNASSSIKQLTPLLIYLRYRAAKNDLLIIDEPELGLHPEAQAKLLEVLAILVNLGVKVLLTTHSPYFMSHLNNLISGDKDNPSVLKKQASALYLNDTRAFLNEEQVSAYEMRDNKLVSLKHPDYGIRWDTLSDVSVDIQQKYFQLSEIKEAKSNGKKKK